MKKSLSADWFKDKSQKDKEAIEFTLRNNPALIQAILDIIDRYDQEQSRTEISLSEYDSPSWGYKQADRNGAKRQLAKFRQLFIF